MDSSTLYRVKTSQVKQKMNSKFSFAIGMNKQLSNEIYKTFCKKEGKEIRQKSYPLFL